VRLYSGSALEFVQDSIRNQVAEKLKSAFFSYYRFNPSPNEVNSWRNSLRAMAQIVQYAVIFGVMIFGVRVKTLHVSGHTYRTRWCEQQVNMSGHEDPGEYCWAQVDVAWNSQFAYSLNSESEAKQACRLFPRWITMEHRAGRAVT